MHYSSLVMLNIRKNHGTHILTPCAAFCSAGFHFAISTQVLPTCSRRAPDLVSSERFCSFVGSWKTGRDVPTGNPPAGINYGNH